MSKMVQVRVLLFMSKNSGFGVRVQRYEHLKKRCGASVLTKQKKCSASGIRFFGVVHKRRLVFFRIFVPPFPLVYFRFRDMRIWKYASAGIRTFHKTVRGSVLSVKKVWVLEVGSDPRWRGLLWTAPKNRIPEPKHFFCIVRQKQFNVHWRLVFGTFSASKWEARTGFPRRKFTFDSPIWVSFKNDFDFRNHNIMRI